jgi:hypothetical protein
MHIHTEQSDGVLTPEQLVANLYALKKELLGKDLDLRGFSVCDHQTLTGVPLIIESLERFERDNSIAPEHKLRYLVGAEFAFGNYHMTAYFPRIGDESNTDVYERAISILKPDNIDLIMIDEITADKPDKIVDQVHAALGIVGIAHPPKDIGSKIAPFIKAGIDTIETRNRRFTEVDVQRILALADTFKLLPTGGSDYHLPEWGSLVFAPSPTPFSYFEKVEQTANERYRDAVRSIVKADPKRSPPPRRQFVV